MRREANELMATASRATGALDADAKMRAVGHGRSDSRISARSTVTPGNGSKLIKGEVYGPKGAYNPPAINGLPVGVQVVGHPWPEEKVLAMMRASVVDAVLWPRWFRPGS